MDQQYWSNWSQTHASYPPIPEEKPNFRDDSNIAPEPNKSVNRIGYNAPGISACEPQYPGGIHNGNGCYNNSYHSYDCNQSIGPSLGGLSTENISRMTESYMSHSNLPRNGYGSFSEILHDYGMRPKQESIELGQPNCIASFNIINPILNSPLLQFVSEDMRVKCFSPGNPGTAESNWIREESSSGTTKNLPLQENRYPPSEIDSGSEVIHQLKNRTSEKSDNSFGRRKSPERKKFIGKPEDERGSLSQNELSYVRFKSTSRLNRSRSPKSTRRINFSRSPMSTRRLNRSRSPKSTRRINGSRSPTSTRRLNRSRSPKSTRRSLSPLTGRSVVSSKDRVSRKSLDLRRETHSSKICPKHINYDREKLVEWRNKGLKTDGKDKVDLVTVIEREKEVWTRSAPADLFYTPGQNFTSELKIVSGTNKLVMLCNKFEEHLLKKAELVRADLPKYEPLQRKKKIKKHGDCHSSSSSCSSSESDGDEDCTKEELEHKKKHPLRLHEELWFNDPGEMNDGPLCRCSAKARRSGIRHNIYAGEGHLIPCDPNTNNADRLYHYRITISPATNFLVSTPTIIEHDNHEYIFEGFSMFSHKKLEELPLCKVIRFNIEYTIVYYEEPFPQNFTVRELNLFFTYLFQEILELVDLDLKAAGDPSGCTQYHFMPRFVRELAGNGKEILSMNEVLKYLLQSAKPLIPKEDLTNILNMPNYDWQRFTENVKGMIVTYPGKKPCSLRVDQLDRDNKNSSKSEFPEIVHFGIRPPQLSYAGNPEYQKAWREYVKFRHLLANMPKPSYEDKRKLECKENKLQIMRTRIELRRNVTVTVSSENFHKTGIMCDVVQHGMLIPVLVTHLRFHQSLDVLEEKIHYKFSNRYLLQLALTHPSYRENFGTNPDHARNSLTNCGIRQPVYGDRKIHYQNTRKRGINTLINIMSRFGKKTETESQITHNERLEFLGDAVVEFVTSVHLFHIFSDLEEGGLATYRAAIVQNQHLAVLAKTLRLEEFMLYAHGSDLCHDLELRHAMANCFEALMGALFLDGGIEVADKVFGEALFHERDDLLDVWVNYPPHPLQEQEPIGDRKWITKFPWLQHLAQFEESIGVQFNHIRLLARAFTDRSMGYTNLTLGSNQRLEFLGDTVLQLIASEYLYKHFPEHHEGHLSLLRSSLVNNRTQAVVCNDLDMTKFAKYSNPKAELKTKDRADLLEAFLGALYVDQDLEFCQMFCNVCFFPRLHVFITNQDWNDPKSKLQQCCLTLRTMEGGEPEIPVYKVIECMGPTNTRIYSVAVYFKNKRLAKAYGHSIQEAEMNAAKRALRNSQDLFPQLDHQRRVISKSMNRQTRGPYKRNSSPKTSNSPGSEKSGTKEERDTSLSPAKNNVKKDDVFSQKIRSRTPPQAYKIQKESSSPENASKIESETDSDASCHEKPLSKRLRRIVSSSNSSKFSSVHSSLDNPCCGRKSSTSPTDPVLQPSDSEKSNNVKTKEREFLENKTKEKRCTSDILEESSLPSIVNIEQKRLDRQTDKSMHIDQTERNNMNDTAKSSKVDKRRDERKSSESSDKTVESKMSSSNERVYKRIAKSPVKNSSRESKFPRRKNRASSPETKLKCPIMRTRSPSHTQSQLTRARSPWKREKKSLLRKMSPDYKLPSSKTQARSPNKLSKSPFMRTECPGSKAFNAQSVGHYKRDLSRSPSRGRERSVKEDIKKNMMDFMLGKRASPGIETKSQRTSPDRRSRIPDEKSRSPQRRARSPPLRKKCSYGSPKLFENTAREYSQINKKSPSRSSPRRKGDSSKEDFKKNMVDFMHGRRSSPGIETKNQKGASWLVDLMFEKSSSQSQKPAPAQSVSTPIYPSTWNNKTQYNHNPQLRIDQNSTQLYNQSGYQYSREGYESQQGVSSSNNSTINRTPGYPPPSYHY